MNLNIRIGHGKVIWSEHKLMESVIFHSDKNNL